VQPIECSCPHCAGVFTVPSKAGGKEMPCPQCRKQLTAPSAPAPPLVNAAGKEIPFQTFRQDEDREPDVVRRRRYRVGMETGNILRILAWIVFLFVSGGEFAARVVASDSARLYDFHLALFLACFAFDRILAATQDR
jgi:hypothetical protein